MSRYWNTERIASLLGQRLNHATREVLEITTDSRQVKPGSVFFAIKGDTHDGHHFIQAAINAGAIAVVSEVAGTHPHGEFFTVESTLDSIRTLAHHYRKSYSIPFIAVVGAVGKTTTKELISSIFLGRFKSVSKTLGSQNGFLGIPLTILSLDNGTDAAVIEIGIDDIGAMEKHLGLVEPTHVILTKIGPEHLHQLKTVAIAAEEELKAFDYALQMKLPLAINLSDDYVNAWFQKNHSHLTDAQFLTYSLEKTKTPELLGIYDPDSSELTVLGEDLNASFSMPLPGEHHAHNLLASITLSQFFKLSVSEIREGLTHFKTAYGRTEIHNLPNHVEIIGDYYNSNPTSLEAALNLLVAKRGSSACIAVLGDMLELGQEEERFHREIAKSIINHQITSTLLFGPRMQWLKDELQKNGYDAVSHFSTLEELVTKLKQSVSPHTKILIKGSRGMKMEKVLQALIQEAKST